MEDLQEKSMTENQQNILNDCIKRSVDGTRKNCPTSQTTNVYYDIKIDPVVNANFDEKKNSSEKGDHLFVNCINYVKVKENDLIKTNVIKTVMSVDSLMDFEITNNVHKSRDLDTGLQETFIESSRLKNNDKTTESFTEYNINSEDTSVEVLEVMKFLVETTRVTCGNKLSQTVNLNNHQINIVNDSKQESKSGNVCLEHQTENLINTGSSVLTENNLNDITKKDVGVINDHENIKNTKEVVHANTNTSYRCESESDSWSDDEDSSSSSSDTSSDSDFFQMVVESSSGPKNAPEIKTRGELGLDDLPPIEDLMITIPEEDMVLIGKVHAVVEKLVVVHAVKDMKPLDIDSVLFLTHNKALGRIYDVFGPVVEPYYCIRFNSVDDIKEKMIDIGANVFFAPEKDDITSYVFVDVLQKEKGSDASWKHNNEPPEEFLDFSDDEQEKAARRQRMNKNRNQRISASFDTAAKKPFSMSDSNSQQNLIEVSRNPSFCCTSTPAPAFRRLNRPYSSHHHRSFSPSVPSVFDVPILTPLSRPYPLLPPPSPTPSDSSIFTAPRFTPFSASYPHPPPSPSPSVSSVSEFAPFSNSCPPPPLSPTVSNVTGTLRFHSFPSPYPPPSPSPSVSVIEVSSSFSNSYPPRPPSPTPSVCSVMSVSVRARTQTNFSTQRQPCAPFGHFRRPFSPRPPQRFPATSFNPQPLRTTPPQQSAFPAALQSHEEFTEGSFTTPNTIQRHIMSPQNEIQRLPPPQSVMQRPPLPPQNIMQRPPLPPQNIMQRPPPPQNAMQSPVFQYQRHVLPPALAPQTHVFGQVSLMSPLPSPLPPPPINMPSFIPPASPTNYFPVNPQDSPYHSPNVHVPPHYPLKIEIPNLNNPSIPVNPFLPGNVLSVSNNVIGNGQPPMY